MQKISINCALAAGCRAVLPSKFRKLGVLAWLCLTVSGASSVQAQLITNIPAEATYAFGNPLMGFRNDLNSYSQYPYRTVVRQYIRWNQIENHESDTVQKIRDFCNAQWANLPTNNVKVIPRVYLDWSSETNNEYWPADLQNGDWTSQQFKDRVVRLIGRLGEVWDNDPRVAWVQTGIIGYWGEQENPVGVDEDGWAQRMGDAYTNAFKNKKLVVRNMNHWPGYEMGLYWDSFSHPAQSGQWATHRSIINQGRYQTQVIEGEVAYGWGTNVSIPRYGATPNETLTNPQYTDNIIETIRELHASALGWVASYNPTDPTMRTNADRMQREFGYRFHINEFACSPRAEPGSNLVVRFKVINKGSAPFYENWPVAVVLVNEATRQMVWKATLPNVDVRDWQPGAFYDTNAMMYLTPAQEHEIAAAIQLPPNLAVGQYLVGLSILEPMSRTPGVFFAVTNFFKQSQTQPLVRIGIGTNASSHALTGVAFDHLENDDKRYYTMTPQGTTNYLLALPSTNGFISLSPGGGSYVNDTGVEVKANGILGYAFSSWGGALAGLTNNPAIIVMDTNKTISANYVAVPTYSLNTSAINGSVTLNPPGGVYNAGTVVTVTANPNRAYGFGSWSGNLAGTNNPATITMDGNKSVTANFVASGDDIAPWLETFTLANGAKSNGPPTRWAATRSSGTFQVSGNRLMINGSGVEGVLETADIGIAGGSVKASLEVMAGGGLDSGDYVRFYKIVDGGPKVLIAQQIGNFPGTNTMVGTGITGNKLKLRIETRVSASDEFYYFDNLKVEDEVSPPTFTLTTSAPNGAIVLNPPGGVYATGTVVRVTANPNYGYGFDNWSGDLSGSANPATLVMNGNKSVTANFRVSFGEPLPWIVNFDGLANGTTSQPWPTSWTATRGGPFRVINHRLEVNGSGGEGVFTTGVIDVSGRPVNLSLDVLGAGGLDASGGSLDYVRLYIRTNGGPETLIRQVNGPQPATNWTHNGITGTNLQVVIRTVVTANDEFYYFDNLIVSNLPPISPIVSITQPLPNAVFDAGANIPMAASATDPDGTVVKVEYFVAGTTKIGESSVGPAYAFTWTNAPAGRHELKAVATDDAGARGGSSVVPITVRTTLQTAPPSGGQIQIEWVGGGTLQTTTNLTGSWSDVPGAVSPHLQPGTNSAQFFRVKQ